MSDKPRILIVDDEPDACTSLRRILKLDGYAVDIAHSFSEMLTARDWTSYFAVLLDRKLPDGIVEDFLPTVKERAPQASIVIITGNADVQSSIAALREGVEDYIIKPIDPNALRASLIRIQKLRDAEQRVQQAGRLATIGQMTTVLTHECRNMLQRISASAELVALELERLPDNELALKDLSKIQNAGTELGTLLEEVRHYAAPINLAYSECCLARIWKSAWDSLEETRRNRDVELVECIEVQDTTCECDHFRIEQVFRNLFENAFAACSDPVEIKVSMSEKLRNDIAEFCITIADNGPGLTSEQQPRVLEPFFTTKSKGTGLGMSIVKRITDAHGGDIRVGNGAQRGAEFTITLPKTKR